MLIHRYATEFTDDGNRSLLPTISLGLGVEGYKHRWRSSIISDAEGTPFTNWVSEGTAETLARSTSGNRPVVKTVNGVKTLSFDGVDDSLQTPANWTEGAVKSVTLVFQPTVAPVEGKDIALFGGGMLEYDTSGSLQAWFNGSNADGGVGSSTGVVPSPKIIPTNEFVVVTLNAEVNGIDTHEFSVNKTHTTLETVRTKRGIYMFALGGLSYGAFDIVEAITWPRLLTRAERETLTDSFRALYPTLAFAS